MAIEQAAIRQETHLTSLWVQHQANFNPASYGQQANGRWPRAHQQQGEWVWAAATSLASPLSRSSGARASEEMSTNCHDRNPPAESPSHGGLPPPPPPPPRHMLVHQKYYTAEEVFADYHERFLSIVMGDSWASRHGYTSVESKNIRRLVNWFILSKEEKKLT
jgi:hypothetical protein